MNVAAEQILKNMYMASEGVEQCQLQHTQEKIIDILATYNFMYLALHEWLVTLNEPHEKGGTRDPDEREDTNAEVSETGIHHLWSHNKHNPVQKASGSQMKKAQ